MIPLKTIEDLINKHSSLEKDLSARANLYFPPVQPDEYVELFAEYEVDTCEEFKEKYLTSDAENALFMQAMTYQLGICIPQDLHKAQKLYQELYNDAPADLGPFAIWLGMIYQYGPEDIRNLDKARFFYKQAILAFAWDDPRNTPQLRRQAVRNLMNDQLPIPELLESELLWLDKVMTKSEKEMVLLDLRREMIELAENLEFEKAAQLRDEIENIEKNIESVII